jgi:hypothetical protein
MEKEKDNMLPIGKILITQLGQELATVCKSPGVEGFVEYVKEKWKKYLPDENKIEPGSGSNV